METLLFWLQLALFAGSLVCCVVSGQLLRLNPSVQLRRDVDEIMDTVGQIQTWAQREKMRRVRGGEKAQAAPPPPTTIPELKAELRRRSASQFNGGER